MRRLTRKAGMTAGTSLLAGLLVAGSHGAPVAAARSMTLVVGTTEDRSGGPGPLTLREAVFTANSLGAGTVILPPGNYQVGAAEPEGAAGGGITAALSGTLTISGAGAGQTTIERDPSAPDGRIFTLPTLARYLPKIRIMGVTLRGGRAPQGGAIYSECALTVDSCVFTSNSAAQGGAIYAYAGDCTVARSLFTANTAAGGAAGGGAIYFDASQLSITQSRFEGNRALGGGAAGGAVHLRPSRGCAVSDSSFTSNAAIGGGAAGGAFYNLVADVSLTNCTFVSNSAEGAGSFGGALYNEGWNMHFVNNTITGNSAGSAGGIGNDSSTHSLTLRNSIVARNFDWLNRPSDIGGDSWGGFTSRGHNVLGIGLRVSDVGPTDLLAVDPKLAPLGDYGGLTPTCALLPGSPAIGRAGSEGAPESDQRGAGRPFPPGSAPDIGAFESTRQPIVAMPAGVVFHPAGNPASILDPGATLYDADSATFNGGRLSAAISAGGTAGDRVLVLHEGTAPGQVGAQGGVLTYGGVRVGTYGGGSGNAPLVVSLTSGAATAAAVRAALRRVAFVVDVRSAVAGERTVSVQVMDEGGHVSPAASMIVWVSDRLSVSQAPTIRDTSFHIAYASPLAQSAPGVLAGSTNPGGHVLTAILVDYPRHGVASVQPDGSFIYRPFFGFGGVDRFTYWAVGGGATSRLATCTLTVDVAPPPSTLGARVRGNGASATDSGKWRFNVHVAVRADGTVAGSFSGRSPSDGKFVATTLRALVVTGGVARLYGRVKFGRYAPDEFVADFIPPSTQAPRGSVWLAIDDWSLADPHKLTSGRIRIQ